jgi:hypothetical protein
MQMNGQAIGPLACAFSGEKQGELSAECLFNNPGDRLDPKVGFNEKASFRSKED